LNILIPHSWLKEFLKTKARPKKIAECLSLCGPSVEKIIKKGKEYIYDIEVTTNRVDMMSILGIAREAAAILPQFDIKAELAQDPYQQIKNYKLKTTNKSNKLKINIQDKKLCPRFTAVILKDIKIKPSPKIAQQKLRNIEQRPINNIVDISNYLMHQLGQPIHTFDYDKIKNKTMILRKSRKGEIITTLDGQQHTLSGGDIVIKDGEQRLIDLCGIMGGKNSAVDQNTKKILLFVQHYNPHYIRKTSMELALRTQAAALFEKNVDSEMVLPALKAGINLAQKWAGAKINSKIIDIYPKPPKHKKIKLPIQLIEEYLGVKLQSSKVIKILDPLGIKTSYNKNKKRFLCTIPSWRNKDIAIPQDLIEEIARIYGYHRLPSIMPPFHKIPPGSKNNFQEEKKIKTTLKNWGLIETYTYSLQSREEIENFLLKPKKHLQLKNPLSKEWVYLRKNLLPSLLSVLKQNLGIKNKIQIFEISNIYQPREKKLPLEKQKIAVLLQGDCFLKAKGIAEGLLNEFKVNYHFQGGSKKIKQWHPDKTVYIYAGKREEKFLGIVGLISPKVMKKFGISCQASVIYLDLKEIIKNQTALKYQPISRFPETIEDLTFTLNKGVYFSDLKTIIKKSSDLVKEVVLKETYKKNYTFEIHYHSREKTLTSKEVSKARKKIVSTIHQKGWGKLKGKVE